MERSASRRAEVGGLEVRRALPQRARRTIGAWCFVDHFGPTAPDDGYRMTVGPHPHIGLSTVTWLLEGEGVHTDSLGSEQSIRPGELNLMTAGSGIAHAEETPVGREGRMHGVQFWVAQPDATRHVRPAFEHGIVALDGPVLVDGELVEADTLVHLDTGRSSLRLGARDATRLVLIGGTPFESPVLMWWNFVGRTRAEIDLATREWNEGSDRFGSVDSGLARLAAPTTPWAAE